jgi:hypothetical protein
LYLNNHTILKDSHAKFNLKIEFEKRFLDMTQTSRILLFVVVAILAVGLAVSVFYYGGVVGNLEAQNASLKSISDDYNVDYLAYSHWSAITARNISSIMSQYAADSKLYWFGGVLNGNFTDNAGIRSEWTKFFTASEIYMNITKFNIRTSGTNRIVSASLSFYRIEITSVQVPVNYALVYTLRNNKWILVEEWWSVAPHINPYIT